MDRLILRQAIVDRIKIDPLLYGKVAYILDFKPGSLRKILADNDAMLTQASVLRILKDHLGKTEDSDLLEEIQMTA